jgi:hypothetical protein
MAKAYTFDSTIASKIQAAKAASGPELPSINLDEATRASIVAAACVSLYKCGARAWDICEWKQRASAWDSWELIYRASECGVEFRRGNQPYVLPHEIAHR